MAHKSYVTTITFKLILQWELCNIGRWHTKQIKGVPRNMTVERWIEDHFSFCNLTKHVWFLSNNLKTPLVLAFPKCCLHFFLLSRFQKIFRIKFRFQFLMNPKVLFISQVILNAQKKTDTILEMPRLEVVIIASRIINKKPFGHVYVSYS